MRTANEISLEVWSFKLGIEYYSF